MSSPSLNSGTTWEGSSRPRALKVKSCQLTRFTNADPTMSRHSALFLSINPEPEFTTCTRSTETLPWTEPSVNCTKKWPVTTEPHRTQFQLSEQWFWTERTRSEDQNHTCSEKTASDSQFWEPAEEPVKADTELSSRPTDQIPSSNEHDKGLFKRD